LTRPPAQVEASPAAGGRRVQRRECRDRRRKRAVTTAP